DLNTYIHKGAIITFKRNNHFKSEKTVDDVLKIEIPESRGYQYLVEDIQKMRDMFQNGQTDFDRRTLLQNKYNKNQEPEYKTVPGYTQVIEAANKDDAVQNELPN
ncbi:hypothetical protein, partial [Bacillus toyonensis]